MKIKSILPIAEWLPHYNKTQLKGDLSAGITVGVMLIPQGMAYASIAGLPAVYGLYASVIPLLVYAIFGTSRHLAVGPVAMVSLLIATTLGGLGDMPLAQYINYAMVLALMVGVIQLLLGLLRLGFLVNFLSHPVISGFTSAAALIIGLNQLKHLLGIDISRTTYINEILIKAFRNIAQVNGYAILIGIIGIALIVGLKKINRALPGQLIAVIFGILFVTLFNLGKTGQLAIIKEVPQSLPAFMVPNFDWHVLKKLFPMAFTIALISFMESIAVAKAIQRKHRNYKVVPNQELIGLGLSNLVGSLFQSFPTAGGFSRTAVNNQAGAQTSLAAVFSAILIVITLLVLTPLFYNLPKTILASVIMVAVFGLIDLKEPRALWKSNKTDFFLLLITFIATLAFGIEWGIICGVCLSLGMVIYMTTKPHVAVLANVPGTHFYRNIDRFKDNLVPEDDVLIYRFDARIYFANTNFFKETLDTLVVQKGCELRLIIIDGESINSIDSSGIHMLKEIIEMYSDKGIDIVFSGIKGPVRDVLLSGGIVQKIGFKNFYMSVQEAVDAYESDSCNGVSEIRFNKYIKQSNK